MATDIYNQPRRVAYYFKNFRADPSFGKGNYELIEGFIRHSKLMGISDARLVRYLGDFRILTKWLEKPWKKVTKKDIEDLIIKLESSAYAPESKRTLKVTLRKFMRWMRGTTEYPEEVSWINMSMKDKPIKKPEDMLTEDDVMTIVRASNNPRNKAFITTLYESGCRIGEILPIKIKDLRFDEYGALMHVDGKTGYRRVRLVASVPQLKAYLNEHPNSDNPNAYFWHWKNGHMTYHTALSTLAKLGKKTGIKKALNPHNFRHSRATFLANHLTESQMKEYLGWIQASRMAQVYVHLSGRDVDRSILKMYGMEMKGEEKKTKIAAQSCPQCKTSNPPGGQFCTLCGTPLSEEVRARVLRNDMERKNANNALEILSKDPDFMRMLTDKLDILESGHSHNPQPQAANTIKADANVFSWKKPTEPDASAARICAPDASPTLISSSARRACAKSAGRGSSGSTTCGGAGNEGKD